MKTRKAFILLMAVSILVMVFSFGNYSINAKNKIFRVAYVARTLSDPFASWLANEIKTQAKGYVKTFKVDILDAQGDNAKSNSLIEICILKKYDCIIIQSNDGNLQRPYVQKAIKAGICVITTNPKILNLPGSSSVDANPYEQGAVLARDAAKRVPKNGRIVIMSCLPGNLHTTARYDAFQKEFVSKRPDVKILADKTLERASEADSMATFEAWVQSYGQIDCALTTADALVMGCLEAVKNNPKYAKLLTYGVDGISGGLLKIKDGVYNGGTCLQNATELAKLNLKAAYELLTGKKKHVEYSISAIFINQSNVDKYLDEYVKCGLLTAEEVKKHRK
jgi:inositol transport system substrate-binding protein